MIAISRLAKSFGDRTLFEDVTLLLQPGARYGLVGANGSGKTTLLSILSGDEPASDGEVTVPSGGRVGVLRQDRYLSEQQRIVDVAMMGDRDAWDAIAEQTRLLALPEPPADAVAELEERVRNLGGYTLPSRAAMVLEGLGIGAARHQEPLSALSGGFKLRVLLAQVLVGEPDLLLLDEPTNHLDILTIRWLEKFLCERRGCTLVISHDHRFLDNVATHILDVDYQTVTLYHGNYGDFARDKELLHAQKEAEIARIEKDIADKKAFVERFRYKATKARQAQSRLKQIEKIEIPELPQTSRKKPHFRFEQARPSGRDVLAIDGVSKAFDDNRVLERVRLTVGRGERVAVIGANGLGKSTLLKVLVGQLSPDAGTVGWGYETHVGYFPQNHRELLADREQTALDYLWEVCPREPTNFVRGQLGRVLFSGEDVDKRLASLSGGEAARLLFARLIVQRPNVLVLDEPTNHLDLESIEALCEAIGAFEGTVLLVSHDRWFVSQLCTRVVELLPGGMRDYPGSYPDYVAHCGDDHLDATAVANKAAAQRAGARAEEKAARNVDWEEQKRRKSEHRKLSTRRDRVTEEIAAAEQRLAAIRALYCQTGFFEQTPREQVAALEAEEASLGPRIDALMSEWESLEQELAGSADEP